MSMSPTTPVTLLAAVDYSELSALVTQQAIEIAKQKEAAEIHFLHVTAKRQPEDEQTKARSELSRWLGEQLRGATGVASKLQLVAHEAHGDPAQIIVEMANDLLTDMVIVGTHGRTGVQRLVMGSVAESVVRHCGCPVLVLRHKSHNHPIPQIEPPCPRCVDARTEGNGAVSWCEQHSEKHGRRHTYYDARAGTWGSHRVVY
jgi:nucleotide-binding universal stress UspA family protein